MALIRYQPNELYGLRHDMNRLFDTIWNGPETEAPTTTGWRPSVDISETQNEFIVTADLPGINREDLDVSVNNGRLTIRGERRQTAESGEGNVHRVERVYGAFARAFDLPSAVNADNIGATYRDGVLSVTVPKAEEAKPKQIEVKIAS